MVQFKKRPVYTPASKIQSALYSIGKEYMYAETLEEYIGLYHIYPNGAIYSQAHFSPKVSKPLVQYVGQSTPIEVIDEQGNGIGTTTLNNSMYYRMTETRFNNHYAPPYHYPEPALKSYEFERKNSDNTPGIDEGLYKFLKLKWTIDGPIDDVRKANQRVMETAERDNNFIDLHRYLSDLDEFHRNRHKQPE